MIPYATKIEAYELKCRVLGTDYAESIAPAIFWRSRTLILHDLSHPAHSATREKFRERWMAYLRTLKELEGFDPETERRRTQQGGCCGPPK